MVEAANSGSFITGIPGAGDEAPNQQMVPVAEDFGQQDAQSDQDSDANDDNQFFEVDQAEPPTNYNDAYSTLPEKIKLHNIKVSKDGSCQYINFLNAFWYVL